MDWLSYTFIGSIFLLIADSLILGFIYNFVSDDRKRRIVTFRPLHILIQVVIATLLLSGAIDLFFYKVRLNIVATNGGKTPVSLSVNGKQWTISPRGSLMIDQRGWLTKNSYLVGFGKNTPQQVKSGVVVVNTGDTGLIRVVKPVYLDKEFVEKFGQNLPFPEGGFNDGEPLKQGVYQVSERIADRIYGPSEDVPDLRSESDEKRSTIWKVEFCQPEDE